MRYIAIILIIYFAVFNMSCVSSRRSNVLTVWDLAAHTTYKNINYYIVSATDLLKTREPRYLTYVGSTEKYHLVRNWIKYQLIPGEVSNFAIAKSECKITEEKTPEAEKYYYENFVRKYRYVTIEDGRCEIPPSPRIRE